MNCPGVQAALAAGVVGSGETLKSLSLMIGRNPSYLQQFVQRGTPRALDPRDREHIARRLGIDEASLAGETFVRCWRSAPRRPKPARPVLTVRRIAEYVAFEVGKPIEQVLGSGRAYDLWLRRVTLWLARHVGRLSVVTIAGELGRARGSVTKQMRHAARLHAVDPEFRDLADLIAPALWAERA